MIIKACIKILEYVSRKRTMCWIVSRTLPTIHSTTTLIFFELVLSMIVLIILAASSRAAASWPRNDGIFVLDTSRSGDTEKQIVSHKHSGFFWASALCCEHMQGLTGITKLDRDDTQRNNLQRKVR